MSNRVNTSAQALRDFANAIEKFIEGQEQIIGDLVSKYNNLSSEWDDVHYQRFGECINEVISKVKDVIPEWEDTIYHLKEKASIIDSYFN